jgi:ATP/maltotriose-dependent transcriptional regulator MalT
MSPGPPAPSDRSRTCHRGRPAPGDLCAADREPAGRAGVADRVLASWCAVSAVGPVRRGSLPGRGAELAVLDDALARAEAGHAQVVLIEAEPGLGKSALLDSFLDRGGTGELVWLRCDEFESDLDYSSIDVLLDDPATVTSRVAAGRRLLSRLSEAQSSSSGVTILAIDDAQWMDLASAQALRFALRRLRDDRVLTVIARRPHPKPDHDLLDGDVSTTIIRLGALDAASVHQLASQLRSWDLPTATVERLVQRTGGLPVLVVAVLRGVDHPDQLVSGSEVPGTVAAAVARLLGSVPQAAQRLVQASSVLGESTDLSVLGRVADVDDPYEVIESAVAAGLLTATSDAVVDTSHELLRAAVYSATPTSDRRELHARASRWTTGDRSLAHRASAADRADRQLATELVRAADAARAAHRYDLAASHRLRARATSDDAVLRDQLLLEALIDRVASLRLSAAEELAAIVEPFPSSALRSLALGLLDREAGRVASARTLLQAAVDQARADGDRPLIERAGLAAAVLYVSLNDGEAALGVIGEADSSTDPELAHDARTTRGIAQWLTDDSPGALALLGDMELSRTGRPWEADLLGARGMINLYSGHLLEALADFDQAVDLVHLWRPSTSHVRIFELRSTTRFWLGDWTGASVDAAAALALSEGGTAPWSLPLAHAVTAEVAIGRGRWSVASEHLAAARSALELLAPDPGVEWVSMREAVLLLVRLDFTGVLELVTPLGQADQLARLAPFRPYRWVVPSLIYANVWLGRVAEAERILAEYETMLDRWPGGMTPSRLGWLRAQIAEQRGDLATARAHYADDLDDPDVLLVPYVHAQTLFDVGRLDRALGDPREAIVRLRQAQSILAKLPATPFLRRCAFELKACGQQTNVADPLGLTPREDDVASLVARGYTNKEIGAELFLTVKSVEYHLSNIYAKLGVSSRSQLRRLRSVV